MKIFVLGILVHPTSKPTGFQGNGLFFRQLADEGAKLGIAIFVFSPIHVYWKQKVLEGYLYDLANNKWRWRKIPFPKVVYDRYFNLGKGWRAALYCRRNFGKKGVSIFNPVVADKFKIHCQLNKDQEIALHIPETYLFKGVESEQRQLLNLWDKAYLKPVLGTKGEGIIRISHNGKNGKIYIEEARKSRGNWASGRKAIIFLQSLTKNKKYIIQKAIEPLRWNDKIFDLRVLVQRGGEGNWQITGMAARQASNGITCNLHTGASAISLDSLWDDKVITITQEEIEKLSLKIAQRLTAHYPSLGELGLDFLVDQDNKLWFLEANARPGRIIFQKIGDEEKRLMAVRRPLEYAKYLASQKKSQVK
ncbi:YheC/YheD family protein [Heliorestis acidaminivorans]|uniref:YheC/YheD family protein n=1 Tax=Heliorestis acidaminivorans TaxID=553427 RepID=A0A6I0F386_9FIRM|nr:YheC/YheD family protein [Heliorestis acidaminivorans]KAB2954200.1 YheC/YheD family protein [Heliorestis acidaminivorans]